MGQVGFSSQKFLPLQELEIEKSSCAYQWTRSFSFYSDRCFWEIYIHVVTINEINLMCHGFASCRYLLGFVIIKSYWSTPPYYLGHNPWSRSDLLNTESDTCDGGSDPPSYKRAIRVRPELKYGELTFNSAMSNSIATLGASVSRETLLL